MQLASKDASLTRGPHAVAEPEDEVLRRESAREVPYNTIDLTVELSRQTVRS